MLPGTNESISCSYFETLEPFSFATDVFYYNDLTFKERKFMTLRETLIFR